MAKKTALKLIVEVLKEKSTVKQHIFKTNIEVFEEFKKCLKQLEADLKEVLKKYKITNLEVGYKEMGPYEAEFRFAGDVLYFMMHTNVFYFDDDHEIHKSNYVKENNLRAYCGLIQVFNFLTDSIRYNRVNDIGYLVARIFINKERHYFVEGKRQLGFLYNNFDKEKINDKNIRRIVESAVLYCLDFDLLTPPYDDVSEVTLMEKITESGMLNIKTGKRVGFRFQADTDRLS